MKLLLCIPPLDTIYCKILSLTSELRAKLHEENKQQAEQLKEKADYLEKRRQITIENEKFKWKESFQRKQENWSHFVSQQREAMWD